MTVCMTLRVLFVMSYFTAARVSAFSSSGSVLLRNNTPCKRFFGTLKDCSSSTTQTIRTSATRLSLSQVTQSIEIDKLEILKYPHPALRNKNELVNVEDKDEMEFIRLTSRKMFELMYSTDGVGLAAPQVGINKRFMVYNPTGDAKKWLEEQTLVNPKIVEYSEAKEDETEGCLSFPGMNGTVSRSKWIKIEAQNLKGKKMKKKFVGWEARIFQHEYDHLEGIVYPDRLSDEEKNADSIKGRLQELVTEYGDGGIL